MNLRTLSIALGTTLLVNVGWAAGPDVCAALPVAKVSSITHQNLTGVRPDISEEAHSYGCSYGSDAHISVSVIRPGGSQAAARTLSRFPHATAVAGLGDKAFYDKTIGVIAVFGDTAIDAFIPHGQLTDAQLLEMEKSLVLAVQGKL
jgi:hypothetical protein